MFSTAEVSSLPLRGEIKKKYKWDLTHIYKNDDDWEKDFKWIENNLPEYEKFNGSLSKSADDLLHCLQFDDSIGIKLERLYLYAMLCKDSDMRVTKYQAMEERIISLHSKVSAAGSYIKPELLQIPDEKLWEMVNFRSELRVYRHNIEDLLRTKTHTLSKDEEELLAHASEIAQVPYNTFSMFTNADIRFPIIKDETGNEIEISHARYYAAMYSKDRDFRERAFKNYYKPYLQYANTFASLFNGNLKTNIFNSKARKYKNAREAALDRFNIPVSVYDNLINTGNNNLKPLHRWAAIKKELLEIKELHPYDAYVTVFNDSPIDKYPYDKAKEIVFDSLKPLGKEYLNILKTAFDNRWIDVYETQAKRSGAYSSGTTFGVHPYVLLNWTDLLNDVFTLTHEMGHNMHSHFTGVSQPFPYANYSIFLAEVASTFNESLLLDYFISNASSKGEKLYFLEKYLNNISLTFYRQVMFAEFEMTAYEKTESGIALTPDSLNDLYGSLYQKYWGSEMVVDEEEHFTWARVPHFYYNFYVYQYSTGFAASEVLSKKVKSDGESAVKKYLNFLKAGSSDYSLNILKAAGVDMSSPEPVLSTAQKMNELLNEIESLI
ncbi:MAG: oligoendopeptidase F [Ignavibacteria bacterium RBG_16_34_14]|nr:MAG: oligoendopeptidase F [Ignavibacteria bacterium RBG_16_34_14]